MLIRRDMFKLIRRDMGMFRDMFRQDILKDMFRQDILKDIRKAII